MQRPAAFGGPEWYLSNMWLICYFLYLLQGLLGLQIRGTAVLSVCM